MMSDIEILLRELNEKIDFLFQKVDILNKKVDQLYIFSSSQMVWDDNGFNKPVELEEIKAEPFKPVEPIENFPHQITEDEYKEDSRYAKIKIIYYEVDGVFATFDGKLVEYLSEEYFGIDNLNLFNEDCNIYLRSETKYVDYHMFYEGCTSYFAEHKGE